MPLTSHSFYDIFSGVLCDYAATQKRIVEANGIRFWVETEGQGPPLVLIHGGPGIDHRVFHPDMSLLARDCQLIYYDLRGHSLSSKPQDPNDYGLEQDVCDLEALRQALHLDRINLLGFSYGGSVALRYAALFPNQVHRLIVCSTPVGMTVQEAKEHSRAHPISQALAEAQTPSERKALFEKFYFYRPLSPQSRHCQELAQRACDTEKNKRAVAAYGRAEVIQLIDRAVGKPKVSVPTLFVFGRHDPLVDIERARRAIAALPQASMIVCEESSHHPFVDEPERFAQVVRAFLTTQPP